MAFIQNRVPEFEREICVILARLTHHIHPKIVQRIQDRNIAEFDHFERIFSDKIEVNNYLFDGSACVFPGVRRYVSGQGKRGVYNEAYKAIIDSNVFPRHLWCFIDNGKVYNATNWRESRLGEFELIHIFAHKESEVAFEKPFFCNVSEDLYPHGNFTCAGNVALLPKGMVRPTDNSPAIKAAFYRRYIELYGETLLHGRSGFDKSLVPDWYSELHWNEPVLPPEWESNVNKLLEYRTNRIRHILARA